MCVCVCVCLCVCVCVIINILVLVIKTGLIGFSFYKKIISAHTFYLVLSALQSE